jgi:hypothetical protein
MSEGNTPFDHERHLRALRLAEDELTVAGKPDLATAIGRAYSIHCQEQSRIVEGQRAVKKLREFAENSPDLPLQAINEILRQVRKLEEYTVQERGPWLGVDLFPRLGA